MSGRSPTGTVPPESACSARSRVVLDRYDSNIDLLVELKPGTDLFDLYEITEEIEKLLDTHVDVISAGGFDRRHDKSGRRRCHSDDERS